MTTKQFDCPQCAAQLEYDPDAGMPKCPYCGYEEAVEHAKEEKEEAVEELDYLEFLNNAEAEEMVQVVTVQCEACYAKTSFDPHVTSSECPFCGTQIVTQGESERRIKPKSLLPFIVGKEKALEMWQAWIQGLWFAPNKLKKSVKHAENLAGIYIPHWTYDAETHTDYQGERGDDYWKEENGERKRKTKWRRVSGEVDVSFDDVLVVASDGVPEKFAKRLQPWRLPKLVPYNDRYLSGFRAEAYKKNLEEGFKEAQGIMDGTIRRHVEKDIGGDHQMIHRLDTSYDEITFKHILLPIWISAYSFNDKVYQFLVNGDSGKVMGERPYSWIKITLAVLSALIVAGVIGYLAYYYQ